SAIGFYPTLCFTLVSIAPYCLLLGFALPFSLIVLRTLTPDYPGTKVYIFDNLGDVSGGVLFSFVLVYLATPLQGAFIAQIPLLLAAYRLYVFSYGKNFALFAAIMAVLAILTAGILMERPSLSPETGILADYRESPYGRIQIIQHAEQTTLVQNGRPVSSSQNMISAEETVHFPLAQITDVRRILMISAESRMMAEALKYKPQAIDYVEIDPFIMAAQFRFGLLHHHPLVHEIAEDGRAFLRKTEYRYDAIILNLPEPDTFQINRFYTGEFFTLARQHLSPGGILSFSVKGFDSYLSDQELQKVSILFATARRVFPFVQMLPGNRISFLCRDRGIDTDIPELLNRKNITTGYISGYYYGDVPESKIILLESQLNKNAPLNRDFEPHLVRALLSEWFSMFATSPVGFILVLAVVNLIYLSKITKEEWVLYTTGWCAMGTEILVIFAFQIFFGYIYLQIGWIITVFLAGLLPGAVLGERLRSRGRLLLLVADGMIILLIGLFMGAVLLSVHPLPDFLFMVFGFAVSVLCGFQFPLALHLRGGGKPAVIGAFSADLMGAAFGTMATSVVLIPYAGIIRTAATLMLLKLTSLVIMGRKQ
ncbi:MAG: hypothetical protein Q7U02_14900, partial [Desulfosalsimonadaceae bacterium]|nr:hypothetical protein [Desulfosalsimonadaceae bacterium]